MLHFSPRQLKAAREKLGFSRARLAVLCKKNKKGDHLAEDTIWRIETGKREPRANTLGAIAAALGIAVDDLFLRG
jgi:transcriptional regulator with XRE-family HTH domain